MIITKSPLRVSFAGGGTDFPDFYNQGTNGCVVSSAITPSLYVILQERFDRKIYVGYSRTEIADHPKYIEHELVRECLYMAGITQGVEIKIMADVPSEGSGLGSSSALVVGLLNALYTYKGETAEPKRLAEDACYIEIEKLGKPIGKQDQYIAAYGGLRDFEFSSTGVEVGENIIWSGGARRSRYAHKDLSERLMLFYTGKGRKAENILKEQNNNIADNYHILRHMARLADSFHTDLMEEEPVKSIGWYLDTGWHWKRTLAGGISNPEVDEIYEKAKRAGANGGKLCGAGGSGFLLLHCEPEKQEQVRLALCDLQELPFSLERYGSRVVYNG